VFFDTGFGDGIQPISQTQDVMVTNV